ncbi:MAG: TonB-dependent receptor, partial [Opitutaceae bacterium]|nr:TonB-dependent receptor [Opitutaceae bacterium]
MPTVAPFAGRRAGLAADFRLLSALLAYFLVVAVTASAKPLKFDIAAQPAADALILFSKQSGMDVLYSYKELKAFSSPAVVGEFEPGEAIQRLLKDSPFGATLDSGKFVVARLAPKPGAIKGSLVGEGGRALPEAHVTLRGTGQQATTGVRGEYEFPQVAPGTYLIVATAAGYQPMHITDVKVRAGASLLLGREELRKAVGDVTTLDPMTVRADEITELDRVEVAGIKEKPFSGANVDLPRSINDAQPYYIFDASTIDRSGSTSVEDFLRGQLTMNTSWSRPGIGSSGGITVAGATNSSIDLRGIGTDKTLILVNGRRQMTTGTFGTSNQPDLNLIPMALIDRIEVLPSSASGIYGGSAIGGVVNVVLKRSFSGGEVRVNYTNPMDTDAPTATIGANYGFSLEGGRTQVRLGASWSDGKELTLGERRDIYLSNLDRMLANFPGYFNNTTLGFASERVNITPVSAAQTTLTLKNGTVLTTPRTFVGAGISPSSSMGDLSAVLAANVGQFSRGMANTNDIYNARQGLGLVPRNLTYTASVRREMSPWLELFSDFNYVDQRFQSVYNPVGNVITRVPANAASNPFATEIFARIPSTANAPMRRETLNKTLTVGAVVKLPASWTAALDYTWSASSARYAYFLADSTAMSADLVSGVLNPFVDTVRYPISFDRYLAAVNSSQ